MSDYFIFDDIDTRDYEDILVFFHEVDNTPKRAYKTVEIPARSGEFYMDEGRYEDIDHSYDIAALTKQAGSDFINALACKIGYHRLEDSFNEGEYYSAVFTSGADVSMTNSRDQNTFRITFTRKPQRWLVDGETAITVSSGDTLFNPTQYESSPLLAVKGYGTIGFNGYEVELDNATSMHVLIKSGARRAHVSGNSYPMLFTESVLSAGDTITLEPSDLIWMPKFTSAGYLIGNLSIDSHSGIDGSTARARSGGINIEIPDLTFAKGTASSYTSTTEFHGTRSESGGGGTFTAEYVLEIAYDGASTITLSFTDTYSQTWIVRDHINLYDVGDITGEATQPLLGDPTYIDCDLGDAYKIYDGAYLSLNSNVALGSDLPKLASGSNTVTFDDTVTELKITPRWWKL